MNEKRSRPESVDARRRHIVETAVICFIEQGFHQTGIRDIAKRAGVSLGNIYNHFSGKEELIAEIAALEAEELSELQEALAHAKNPLKALETFTERYLVICSDPAYTALSYEILAESARNPEIGQGFLENRENLLKALERQILGARNGQTEMPEISESDCAEFLLDLIEGTASRLAFMEKKPGRKEKKALKAALRKLL
ncbi:TetR/AcrR family transcriptional regulator [Roseibium sp. MMSF_3544]|uniref:TetR/AcrR family transcriptional regulator n=1 Tax=unclassified Roseibium TaxID=2629323 RepID=UPI00273D304E|nr:TetR/AcrR family transcriptional regulator [Roseibium sp. MMSF_3544]